MPAAASQPSFYYASGKKVPLALDEDWLAFDAGRIAKELSTTMRAQLEDASRSIAHGIGLVARADLMPEVWDKLEQSRAALPVWSAEGAHLVSLPEVRVEESSGKKLAGVRAWLSHHAGLAEIVREEAGMIVLRPTSGRGRDALTLANGLVEQAKASSVSPRFLRITPRGKR